MGYFGMGYFWFCIPNPHIINAIRAHEALICINIHILILCSCSFFSNNKRILATDGKPGYKSAGSFAMGCTTATKKSRNSEKFFEAKSSFLQKYQGFLQKIAWGCLEIYGRCPNLNPICNRGEIIWQLFLRTVRPGKHTR